MMKQSQGPVVQLKVCCSLLPVGVATWEDYDTLRHHFPSVTIWDGVSFEEGEMS